MNSHPQLIVMLTHHDLTVKNAYEVFDLCKHSKAKFWGFKEAPLPFPQMKSLYTYMKEYGKTTFLEVVAYTEKECLRGARMAAECGCDVLIGTMFFRLCQSILQRASPEIHALCRENYESSVCPGGRYRGDDRRSLPIPGKGRLRI